jgi:hypothetical protein
MMLSGKKPLGAAAPVGLPVDVAAFALLSVASVAMTEIFSGSGAQGKKKIGGAYQARIFQPPRKTGCGCPAARVIPATMKVPPVPLVQLIV